MPEAQTERQPLTIGEGLLAFMLKPWVGLLALTGLLVGMLLVPPQGFAFSTCGMIQTMRMPCPGCGLTRSVSSVLHGRFVSAWEYNPFGFVVAACFVGLAPMAVMPGRWRAALRQRLNPRARLIAVVAGILFAGLFVHGMVRIALVMGGHPAYQWWRDGGPAPTLQHEGLVPANQIPFLWSGDAAAEPAE